MTEKAFPSPEDRRQLIAIRAVAARKLVEPLPMLNDESKVRLLDDLRHLAQQSHEIDLPLPRSIQTAIRIQIVDRDPALDDAILDRLIDLNQVVSAGHWPLPWYAVSSHAIDGADRSAILQLARDYDDAARAKDEARAIALFVGDDEDLALERLWFRTRLIEPHADMLELASPAIVERFDGRKAALGIRGAPAFRFTVQRDGETRLIEKLLTAVRCTAGWKLA